MARTTKTLLKPFCREHDDAEGAALLVQSCQIRLSERLAETTLQLSTPFTIGEIRVLTKAIDNLNEATAELADLFQWGPEKSCVEDG